jgi:low affinity Fe/Cu permease
MKSADERPRRQSRGEGDDEKSVSDAFRHLAGAASEKFGSHWAFIAAISIIVGWAATGPIFGFSETWQLIINTGTTIITFLMVFLIQSTQNRDAKAIHLKLDELIRASDARNVFADLEDATEAELEAFQREFEQLHLEGKRGADAISEARDRALPDRERPERRQKTRRRARSDR